MNSNVGAREIETRVHARHRNGDLQNKCRIKLRVHRINAE